MELSPLGHNFSYFKGPRCEQKYLCSSVQFAGQDWDAATEYSTHSGFSLAHSSASCIDSHFCGPCSLNLKPFLMPLAEKA